MMVKKETISISYKLRPLQPGDEVGLAKHGDNKKIWNTLRDQFPMPYTEEAGKRFIEMVQNSEDKILAIEIDGEVAGVVSILRKTDVYKLNAEIGYWISEKYWNKNVMTKAISDIMKIAFEEMQMRRVYAEVFSGNESSCRVLEKNGFKLEAVLKENVVKDNQIRDTYVFSKFNPTRKDMQVG